MRELVELVVIACLSGNVPENVAMSDVPTDPHCQQAVFSNGTSTTLFQCENAAMVTAASWVMQRTEDWEIVEMKCRKSQLD